MDDEVPFRTNRSGLPSPLTSPTSRPETLARRLPATTVLSWKVPSPLPSRMSAEVVVMNGPQMWVIGLQILNRIVTLVARSGFLSLLKSATNSEERPIQLEPLVTTGGRKVPSPTPSRMLSPALGPVATATSGLPS